MAAGLEESFYRPLSFETRLKPLLRMRGFVFRA
jgi:hypothetical protein